ncbi:MAG: VWA domain-containing protein, partial [Planctomycetes bacterium]|nr:VWA domain-containing protein [Planctomycetota bacterium]
GIRIAPEVWKRSADEFAARQDSRGGGWGYTTGSGYGSMTCAGVCSLAICLNELGDKAPAKDPRVARGLAWLADNFSVETHPKYEDRWFFYYLYSLERVGRILNIEFIGTHEWYPLGAKHLLAIQREDGGWIGADEEKDPRLATSFALLFLTRATETLPAEEKRGGDGTLRTGVAYARERRFYIILDASGSMLSEMGGRTKFDIARSAVESIVDEMPEGTEVALRVYGHRKRSIEKGASEDTALEIPLKAIDKETFREKLAGLRARGKTPLALSISQAARDLAREGEVTVILLTDGGEDTLPRQDPLAAADELGKLEEITLHVIGFDIGRKDWSEQLQEISVRAHGKYWPAAEATSLEHELRCAVFAAPDRFSVYDAAGAEVAKGAFGESRTLPEGKYRLRAWVGQAGYDQEFWINTDRVTAVVFHADRLASGSAPPPSVVGAPPAEPPPTEPPVVAPAPEKEPPTETEPKAAPRFCTNCGKPLKPGARFCTNCGQKVGE